MCRTQTHNRDLLVNVPCSESSVNTTNSSCICLNRTNFLYVYNAWDYGTKSWKIPSPWQQWFFTLMPRPLNLRVSRDVISYWNVSKKSKSVGTQWEAPKRWRIDSKTTAMHKVYNVQNVTISVVCDYISVCINHHD